MSRPVIDRTAYSTQAHALANLLAIADEASPAAWATAAEVSMASDCVAAADAWMARICEMVRSENR